MSFQTILSSEMEKRLSSMELPVAAQIRRHIEILGRNTSVLSQPAHALCPQMQMFEFDFAYQGMDYHVMLFFQYAADEQTLHIEDMDIMTI